VAVLVIVAVLVVMVVLLRVVIQQAETKAHTHPQRVMLVERAV
jgi:hypothetical protein